jgi:predicted TIM-barrel fold metal-dependent hydrolase
VKHHIVISGDGHVFGPGNGSVDVEHLGVLTEYFEPRHRQAFLDYREELKERVEASTATIVSGLFDDKATSALAQMKQADAMRGLFDSERRLKDLEGDGIVAEVLFPNRVPFGHFKDAYSQELREAGAVAYNRWLADFCREAPGRRAGMAVVSLRDIPGAVSELRRAKEDGLRGVMLPNYWRTEDIPPFLDPCYEPFWAACSELGMPVNCHGGASIGDVDMAQYGVAAMLTYATETTFLSTRPLTLMIWGGVFERHPDLTFVITESRADWVPSRLAFLDTVYENDLFGHIKETVKHKPSEYWHRQCYVVASFMSRDEALKRDRIGLDRLIWGADYPHFEGTWPHTHRWLKETFGGLPTPEVRAILAENPARVFGFDLGELSVHAEAVGPPIDDLENYEPTGEFFAS